MTTDEQVDESRFYERDIVEPAALAAIEDEALFDMRQKLRTDILGIDEQIGHPYRLGVDGQRLSRDEYADWRRRALHALSVKRKAIGAVNDEIARRQRAKRREPRQTPNRSFWRDRARALAEALEEIEQVFEENPPRTFAVGERDLIADALSIVRDARAEFMNAVLRQGDKDE